MNNFFNKMELFSKSYEGTVLELHKSMLDIELRSFGYEEKAQKALEKANLSLKEIEQILEEGFSISDLDEKGKELFLQFLVSYQPRIEGYKEELQNLIKNPPPERIIPEYEGMEKDEEEALKMIDRKSVV